MDKMIVRLESVEEFLARGNEIAQKVDQGFPLEESCIRSFEDPEDLLALFTPSRRELLAEILRGPGSIDELAIRQRRNKDEIEQDVRMLAKADIVTFEDGIVQSVAKTIVFEPIPQLASEA
ncbi:MarR family transcriptional regulator [Pseudoduganella eburnea]|uniref:MarR family transcriptional regulator n=1 Tax=Massilia eburnea TaxID=1776165 RepID=A0A6L6QJW8_9BURK|nr:MarR family transcriptional regulator [Massilia eburnea]MTW12579.1 MarR family transcriptional regulator [Massilia eburnea]